MLNLGSRYKILEILGEGGIGTTYKATDLQTNQAVAIKILTFEKLTEWKTLELFEREAEVLKQLDQPSIPKYLDSFEVDDPEQHAFCIVQTLAPGKTLAEWVKAGWRPDEAEVSAIATQLLEILIYLQSLTPAIIHRDLKPQNVLRDEQGGIYLVDFGSVQDKYRQTVAGGSTVVGTFGYMAPEQFRGQASLATDLYGLGTTLLFLLTGQDPIDLQHPESLELRIPETLKISPMLRCWLETLIEPALEERCPTAEAALQTLQGEPLQPRRYQLLHRPKKAHTKLVRTDRYLYARFYPHNFMHPFLLGNIIALCVCAFYITFILAGFDALGIRFVSSNTVYINALLFILFCTAIAMIFFTLNVLTRPTVIHINPVFIKLQGIFVFFYQLGEINIRSDYLDSIQLQNTNGKPNCLVIHTTDQRRFKLGFYLSTQEKNWLYQEISQFIKELNSSTLLERAVANSADAQETGHLTIARTVYELVLNAVQFYQQYDQQRAELLLKAALALEPATAEAHNNLGVIQYYAGEHDAAIASLNQALQCAPGYRAASVNLSLTYEAINKPELAIETYATPRPCQQLRGRDELTLLIANADSRTLRDQLNAIHESYLHSNEIFSAQETYAYLTYLQGDTETAIHTSLAILETASTPVPSLTQATERNYNALNTGAVRANLGWYLALEGRIAEALIHLKSARDLATSQKDETSPKIQRFIEYISKPEYAQKLTDLYHLPINTQGDGMSKSDSTGTTLIEVV